jgi:hypothetical protein
MVAPGMRRHGIGTLLTERRISALAGAANEVWCLANLWDRASVALHQRLGSELLTRRFTQPRRVGLRVRAFQDAWSRVTR